MSRKSARESAMKLIFQMDINTGDVRETLDSYYESTSLEFTPVEKEYIEDCVKGIADNKEELDETLKKYLKGWTLSRIARVELAILRLAVYEITKRDDIPNIVSVNEAIELAKIYGGENSANFINGVLGNLVKEKQ